MNKQKPPAAKTQKSMRFCPQCEDLRVFKYNPVIGHSECKVCGGRYAYRDAPTEKVIENYEARIHELVNELSETKELNKRLHSTATEQGIELGILRKRIAEKGG